MNDEEEAKYLGGVAVTQFDAVSFHRKLVRATRKLEAEVAFANLARIEKFEARLACEDRKVPLSHSRGWDVGYINSAMKQLGLKPLLIIEQTAEGPAVIDDGKRLEPHHSTGVG